MPLNFQSIVIDEIVFVPTLPTTAWIVVLVPAKESLFQPKISNIAELKELCAEKGIDTTGMKKAELVAALEK